MSDGYCDNWKIAADTSTLPGPSWPWPLKPVHRPTLFDFAKREGVYYWRCRECGWETSTLTFSRPKHPLCQKKE